MPSRAVLGTLMMQALLAYSCSVWAGCRLPSPDGGGETPSAANLRGNISAVAGNIVRIRQATTGQVVPVRIPKNPEIYSAFGGDGEVTDLAPGQTVQVWFNNCVWPRKGVPISAYFQFYSKDPNDRP